SSTGALGWRVRPRPRGRPAQRGCPCFRTRSTSPRTRRKPTGFWTGAFAFFARIPRPPVLLIDLDAQASLTQLFGILPHIEVSETETALLWWFEMESVAQ